MARTCIVKNIPFKRIYIQNLIVTDKVLPCNTFTIHPKYIGQILPRTINESGKITNHRRAEISIREQDPEYVPSPWCLCSFLWCQGEPEEIYATDGHGQTTSIHGLHSQMHPYFANFTISIEHFGIIAKLINIATVGRIILERTESTPISDHLWDQCAQEINCESPNRLGIVSEIPDWYDCILEHVTDVFLEPRNLCMGSAISARFLSMVVVGPEKDTPIMHDIYVDGINVDAEVVNETVAISGSVENVEIIEYVSIGTMVNLIGGRARSILFTSPTVRCIKNFITFLSTAVAWQIIPTHSLKLQFNGEICGEQLRQILEILDNKLCCLICPSSVDVGSDVINMVETIPTVIINGVETLRDDDMFSLASISVIARVKSRKCIACGRNSIPISCLRGVDVDGETGNIYESPKNMSEKTPLLHL